MLAWQEIETVLLDMDGTLIDLHFDNYFWQQLVPEQWGAARGLDLASAQQALAPVFAGVAGTLNWYCLDHWRRELGLDDVEIGQWITAGLVGGAVDDVHDRQAALDVPQKLVTEPAPLGRPLDQPRHVGHGERDVARHHDAQVGHQEIGRAHV